MSASSTQLRLPYEMGRYVLTERLGAGGMAEVFLAEHRGVGGFKKRLAIKRILPHLAEREQFVEMFFREATVAARINHPNVVQIFELGEHEGIYFIAMEYVDGISLRDLAKEVKRQGADMPIAVWVRALADAASGLEAAHSTVDDDGEPLDVVHRDISPDNLMIGRSGVTKILDFGVAKAIAGDEALTESGEIKGKLPYMAPEQIEDQPLDKRADLYALGISLFWLLTGQGPFHRGSQVATIKAVLQDEPPSLRLLNPDVPKRLDWIVSQLLKKDRDERPSNGAAVREMLLNACPEAERLDYSAVRELIDARRKRRASADNEWSTEPQPTATLPAAATAVTNVTDMTGGTVMQMNERRRSLRYAGVALIAVSMLFVTALVVTFVLDANPVPAQTPPAASTPSNVDLAASPPTTPPAADSAAAGSPPVPEPAPAARARKAIARRQSVAVAGPVGLTWLTTRGEKLRVRDGKLRAPGSARALLAVHAQLGGRVRVPIAGGRADYGAVKKGRATFRVHPFATIYVGAKKLGMTPLDAPLVLPAGTYSLRFVGELRTEKRKLTIKPGGETVVRVNFEAP